MLVTPIAPIYPLYNRLQRNRAVISPRGKDHVVTDTITGKRFSALAAEAWKLHKTLNQKGKPNGS